MPATTTRIGRRPTRLALVLLLGAASLIAFPPHQATAQAATACTLEGPDKRTYTCVIGQTASGKPEDRKTVVMTTELSEDEAKAAAVDPGAYRLPAGLRPFKVKAVGPDGKVVPLREVAVAVAGNDNVMVANGKTEVGFPFDPGGGQPVTVRLAAVENGDFMDPVTVPALAVGSPPPPPPPAANPANNPAPVAPDLPRNLEVQYQGTQGRFALTGTGPKAGATLMVVFDGPSDKSTTYEWRANSSIKNVFDSTQRTRRLTSRVPRPFEGTVTVTHAGKSIPPKPFKLTYVDPLVVRDSGPTKVFAGKPYTYSVASIAGGTPPYKVAWVLDEQERVIGDPAQTPVNWTMKYSDKKKPRRDLVLRVYDSGFYRTEPFSKRYEINVSGCVATVQRVVGDLRYAATIGEQVDESDGGGCGETPSTITATSGTGWYWLEFKAAPGDFVATAPTKADGSYRIAAGYKLQSNGKPQLVAPVGTGAGTLQLRIADDGSCSWNWGSVRGPSCSLSKSGGSVTNDSGVTVAYRLLRMSAADAQAAKAGLGNRNDFDAPDQITK